VEVRDSRVIHYSGNYDSYLYKVNQEIEAGERELANERTKLPPSVAKPHKVAPRLAQKNERDVRKELKTLERTIAQLDEQKRTLNAQLLESTNAVEALRLHNEVSAVSEQLTHAEERWLMLQEQLEGAA
jgi:ATP-binding cassette subfamily F protein 3